MYPENGERPPVLICKIKIAKNGLGVKRKTRSSQERNHCCFVDVFHCCEDDDCFIFAMHHQEGCKTALQSHLAIPNWKFSRLEETPSEGTTHKCKYKHKYKYTNIV